jgi:hypothetical protein
MPFPLFNMERDVHVFNHFGLDGIDKLPDTFFNTEVRVNPQRYIIVGKRPADPDKFRKRKWFTAGDPCAPFPAGSVERLDNDGYIPLLAHFCRSVAAAIIAAIIAKIGKQPGKKNPLGF